MSYKPHQKFRPTDDARAIAAKLNRMQTELSRTAFGGTTIIRTGGGGSSGGGGGGSYPAVALHLEAGVTVAMLIGTAVTFSKTYETVINPTEGDYVVTYTAKDSGGVPTGCDFIKTPTGMTLKPDFDNTTVEWMTAPRTQ